MNIMHIHIDDIKLWCFIKYFSK